MKALVYTQPNELKVLEVEEPKAGAGEMVVRVQRVGICGSDLEGFAGQKGRRVPPLIMGHEFGGVVTALGDGVTGVEVGQRVAVNPLYGCGQCEWCRQGRESICRQRKIVGIHRPGAFAEFVAVPAGNVYALPDAVSDVHAALVEPTANAVHVMRLAGHSLPRTVFVIGAGTIGLLCAQVAKVVGQPQVMISDIVPYRLEVAKQIIADLAVNSKVQDVKKVGMDFTDGDGFDICIDAVGTGETRALAVEMLKPGGTAVWIGLHSFETNFNGYDVVAWEKRIIGSYGYDDADFRKAIQLIASGCIKSEPWVKEFPLTEGVEVFYNLLGGVEGYIKALLYP